MGKIATNDKAYHALHNGMNLDNLLSATGLDRNTFAMFMDNNKWNHEQKQAIERAIDIWERKLDLK